MPFTWAFSLCTQSLMKKTANCFEEQLPVNGHADHYVDGGCHEAVEGRQGQVGLVERNRVEPCFSTLAQSNEGWKGTYLRT